MKLKMNKNWTNLIVLAGVVGATYYVSEHGFTLNGLKQLTNPTMRGDTARAVDVAKQQLAAEYGGSLDSIQLVDVQSAVWSDNSLGCMLPGYSYTVAQPATNQSGWRVLLRTPNGKTWDYRVRSDYLVVALCPYG